jgi:hypothetical protein
MRRSFSNTGTALPETLARTAAEHFEAKARFASEFTTVTDVPLPVENERHRFVGVGWATPGSRRCPLTEVAVWVAKQRPR